MGSRDPQLLFKTLRSTNYLQDMAMKAMLPTNTEDPLSRCLTPRDTILLQLPVLQMALIKLKMASGTWILFSISILSSYQTNMAHILCQYYDARYLQNRITIPHEKLTTKGTSTTYVDLYHPGTTSVRIKVVVNMGNLQLSPGKRKVI